MSLLRMHQSPSRFAAWLGLLAILLLFIAPVMSKSLEQVPARHAAMMMSLPDMPMAEMSPVEHARMMPHHSMPIMDDSACGYCTLLVHLPLDLTSLPLLWSSLQAVRLADMPLLYPVVARFAPRFFHPRAPPTH